MKCLDNTIIVNTRSTLLKHLDVLKQRQMDMDNVMIQNYPIRQHADYDELVNILKDIFPPDAINDQGSRIVLTLPIQNTRVPELEIEIINNLPSLDSGVSSRDEYSYLVNTVIIGQIKSWQRSNAMLYIVKNLLDTLDDYYTIDTEKYLGA